MEKEEFISRFKHRLAKCVGQAYDDGYASEIAVTYWDNPDQRSDGPEECAEAEAHEWAEA